VCCLEASKKLSAKEECKQVLRLECTVSQHSFYTQSNGGNTTYQIFQIKLKPKETNLPTDSKLKALGWYNDERILLKEVDGLQFSLNLRNFILRCIAVDLFPIDEGPWTPTSSPSREELVVAATSELQKLNFEITDIQRIVKHE